MRRVNRVHDASRVGAVRQQDQNAVASFPFPQPLYRQADGVPDGGRLARQADGGFEQQGLDRLAVEGERGLQICPFAEQDQAQAVANAAFDEVARNLFGRCQPVHSFPAQDKIPLLHAAGEVNRQHQLSAANGDFD